MMIGCFKGHSGTINALGFDDLSVNRFVVIVSRHV